MQINIYSGKSITELSNDYKPNQAEEYMCDQHLEYFRRKLIDWKMMLLAHEGDFAEGMGNSHVSGDESDMAHHEVDMMLEMKRSSREKKLIERIDAALMKIDNRTYGYCEHTGTEIGLRRLEARPTATLCITAQERHEKFEKQHNKKTQNIYNINYSGNADNFC